MEMVGVSKSNDLIGKIGRRNQTSNLIREGALKRFMGTLLGGAQIFLKKCNKSV